MDSQPSSSARVKRVLTSTAPAKIKAPKVVPLTTELMKGKSSLFVMVEGGCSDDELQYLRLEVLSILCRGLTGATVTPLEDSF